MAGTVAVPRADRLKGAPEAHHPATWITTASNGPCEMTQFAPPAQPFPVVGFETSVAVRSAPVASRLERRTSPDASPPNPLLSGRKRSSHSGRAGWGEQGHFAFGLKCVEAAHPALVRVKPLYLDRSDH